MYSLSIEQLDTEQVRQLLRENVLKVVFVKSSGEQRTMRCTTQTDQIPLQTNRESSRKPSSTVVAWDLDIREWRSFRCDRLVSVDVVTE